MSKVYNGEIGYYELIKDILDNGVEVPDRTGIGSIALFDAKVVFDESEMVLSTLRPAPLRMAFEEFWMFLQGETQTKQLEEKGIYFWKGNTTREFLDKRGLNYLPEGSMGQAYGFQFRNYGGFSTDYIVENGWDYELPNHEDQIPTKDQLKETLHLLENDEYSRRNLTTFWNPSQSDLMALTPCWHTHQIVVLPDKDGNKVLNMKLINRSLDSIFGFLFAVQQYRLYQIALCKMYGFKLGKLSCDLTQVHIYNNQIEYAKEILTRNTTQCSPEIKITKELKTLEDLISLTWEDIVVEGLIVNKEPFKAERPPMAV